MVIIEPYRWIKSTAIKERLDLANKLNEIIDAIAPIDPDTINDINDRLDALVSADTVINGRIDDLVISDTTINNRITTLDAKNVKTDTEQTITGKKVMTNSNNEIRVKDTPNGIHDAVNQSYVESTIDGVNNLLHKSGNEKKSGWLDGSFRSGSLDRSLGYHKILTLTNRINSEYFSFIIASRYSTAMVRLTIVKGETPQDTTITAESSSITPNSLSLGVGYNSETDDLFLYMKRISGSNIYTNYLCLIRQVGTASNNSTVFIDEVIDEPAWISNEVAVL